MTLGFFLFSPPTVASCRSNAEQVTISYGEKLNAEHLMVQYGFPVPPNLPLERPLCGSNDPVRDSSAEAKAAAGAGLAGAAGGRGGEGGGEGDAEEELPAEGADGEESRGGLGQETKVGLMNELFLRAQQRFAREANGDELQFEIRVSRRSKPLGKDVRTHLPTPRKTHSHRRAQVTPSSIYHASPRRFFGDSQAVRSDKGAITMNR